MKRNNPSVKLVLVPMLLTGLVSPGFAQPKTGPVGPAIATTSSTLGLQAGEHNFTFDSIDQNQLTELMVKLTKDQQDFVLGLIGKSQTNIKLLLSENINGETGLRKLADDSKREVIELAVYQASLRSYEQRRTEIQIEIENLANLSKSVKSTGNIAPGTKSGGKLGNVELNFANIDLSPVATTLTNNLIKIDVGLETLQFRVKGPSGRIDSLVGIKNDIAAQIDFNYLNKLQDEANLLLAATQEPKIQKAIDSVSLFARRHINELIKNYGIYQKWRLNLNPTGLMSAIKDLEDIFWIRSFMRKYYGTGIGVIGVDYTKRALNLDWLLTNNRIQWRSEIIRDRSEMISLQDQIANALITQDSRSKEILARDTQMLSRLNSSITFVRGESQLAAVNSIVLGLLAADINEELLITSGDDGYSQFKENYSQRYYRSDAQKLKVKEREKSYLSKGKNSLTIGSLELNPNTPRGNFNLALNAGLKMAFNKVEQGRKILESIAVLNSDNALLNSADERALED